MRWKQRIHFIKNHYSVRTYSMRRPSFPFSFSYFQSSQFPNSINCILFALVFSIQDFNLSCWLSLSSSILSKLSGNQSSITLIRLSSFFEIYFNRSLLLTLVGLVYLFFFVFFFLRTMIYSFFVSFTHYRYFFFCLVNINNYIF